MKITRVLYSEDRFLTSLLLSMICEQYGLMASLVLTYAGALPPLWRVAVWENGRLEFGLQGRIGGADSCFLCIPMASAATGQSV